MARKAKKATKTCPNSCCPVKGDSYTCDCCGMKLILTADCGCDCDAAGCDGPCFKCCGQEMTKDC